MPPLRTKMNFSDSEPGVSGDDTVGTPRQHNKSVFEDAKEHCTPSAPISASHKVSPPSPSPKSSTESTEGLTSVSGDSTYSKGKDLLPPSTETSTQNPHDNDVLCGRGGNINTHPGNETFREFVEKRKRVYLTARFKREKRLIADSIVSAIRNLDPPGRFLAKDPETNIWHDIGNEKARDKTSQALRENAPSLRKEIEVENDAKRAAMMRAEEEEAARASEAARHYAYGYYPHYHGGFHYGNVDHYDDYYDDHERNSFYPPNESGKSRKLCERRSGHYPPPPHHPSIYSTNSYDYIAEKSRTMSHDQDDMESASSSGNKSSHMYYSNKYIESMKSFSFVDRKKPSFSFGYPNYQDGHHHPSESHPCSGPSSSNLRSSSFYQGSSDHGGKKRSVHFDEDDRVASKIPHHHHSSSRHHRMSDTEAPQPWQDTDERFRRRHSARYSGEYQDNDYHSVRTGRRFQPISHQNGNHMDGGGWSDSSPYHSDCISSGDDRIFHRLPTSNSKDSSMSTAYDHNTRSTDSAVAHRHQYNGKDNQNMYERRMSKSTISSSQKKQRSGSPPLNTLSDSQLSEDNNNNNSNSNLLYQFATSMFSWDSGVAQNQQHDSKSEQQMEIEPITSCSSDNKVKLEEGQEVELITIVDSMDISDSKNDNREDEDERSNNRTHSCRIHVTTSDTEVRTPPPVGNEMETDWSSKVVGCHSFFTENIPKSFGFGFDAADIDLGDSPVNSMDMEVFSLSGTEGQSCAGSIGGQSLCNVFDIDTTSLGGTVLPDLASSGGNSATPVKPGTSDRSLLNLGDAQLSLVDSHESFNVSDSILREGLSRSDRPAHLNTETVAAKSSKEKIAIVPGNASFV